MAQIDFKNIIKRYGDLEVLKNVSFSIDDDDFVFLVGPSGAGKSTLVKLLIREEFPDAGEIIFKGTDILQIPQADIFRLRRKIGVVFQDFKLLNSKNVYDNVAIALEVTDTPKKVMKDIVTNVLAMVGLQNKMDYMPFQLSGGEKQRVSIARALAHEPDVLVADEPTGMIDPRAAEEVLEILENINTLGTTIIMATHDANVVNKMKKRVIRIENGVLTSDKKGGNYND